MKRATIILPNKTYSNHILIESITDFNDFSKEKLKGVISDSSRYLIDKNINNGEQGLQPNDISVVVEKLSTFIDKPIYLIQSELLSDYESSIHKILINGNKIAITPKNLLSYFIIPTDAKVIITSTKESYTTDDIHISRYYNGVHYYAKIDKIDVVIDGCVKWNSHNTAYENAVKFLKTL